MTRWITLASLMLALALAGCAKEAPKAEAPKAEAPKAEAPKAEAPKAEAPAAPAEAAKPAEAPAEAPAAAAVPSEELKTKLAAAYADVYCAQIAGKPEAVLDAYKRHGYENLDDWSRAWRTAAKDVEWVKQVMTDAKNACPK